MASDNVDDRRDVGRSSLQVEVLDDCIAPCDRATEALFASMGKF
jgi:hypothetical protein